MEKSGLKKGGIRGDGIPDSGVKRRNPFSGLFGPRRPS